ncbi:MAG: DUF2948 family protein [Alphaproteobacteria bacterium]|nr:DUF2948 family protein [Alphaproteobacteria bacterium]MBL7099210.1 DUF2948 family protein [Alphaproteobacteria bacterium]
MNSGLTLAAEDAADLEIISARLQDAIAQMKDFVYLPKKRRFAALFNRFVWEADNKRGDLRVRTGLHFDGVLSVKSHKLKRGAPDAVVSLLAIQFSPKGSEDPGGTVELVFAGGGALRLEVEVLDAGLTDLAGPWAAMGRPEHEET